MQRVVVAMSGGVDSSVTASLLKEQGYEVIGVTMQIWPSNKSADEVETFGGCCSLSAVEDARRVADRLGIPHYVMNFRDIFAEKVIKKFCEEYSLGRTPNPCIRCNRYVKFGALLKRAKQLDAAFVATGHYARIEYDKPTCLHASRTHRQAGRYLLKRGIDPKKDQSYVLYVMTQDQLRHVLMPLGNFTKEKVRQMAQELALPVATKPASQEICFIPDDNYGRFLQEYVSEAARPGPILDRQGNILGGHRGILFYTIGQRRGLGISAKEPLYVTAIDRERNAIVVGNERELYADELIATEVNWVATEEPTGPLNATAKIRYRHQGAEARVTPLDRDKVHVKFKEPQKAITPGQAVVFYDEDIVVGGGTIFEKG